MTTTTQMTEQVTSAAISDLKDSFTLVDNPLKKTITGIAIAKGITFQLTHGSGINKITERPRYMIDVDGLSHALVVSRMESGVYTGDIPLTVQHIGTSVEELWKSARLKLNKQIKQ